MKPTKLYSLLFLSLSITGCQTWVGGGDAERHKFEALQPLAEQGDRNAQNNLGARYHSGEGTRRDYQKAMEWYRKSASQGNTTAQSNIGLMYERGKGVSQDSQKALEWYKKAADGGDKKAKRKVGKMYEQGEGISQDYKKAGDWYKNMCLEGDRLGCNRYQDLARDGLVKTWKPSTSESETIREAEYRAASLSRRSEYTDNNGNVNYVLMMETEEAERGDASAQYNLGVSYAYSKESMVDEAKATYWFKKAAIQGHSKAQYELGKRFVRGTHVIPSLQQAAYWFNESCSGGYEKGCTGARKLAAGDFF